MSHPVASVPARTPPPPLNILPRTRHRDRSSYSSTLTASTSSGSSTLSALLVSPTTPTKPEFAWTAVVRSPVREVVDYEDEHHDGGSWGPRTPRTGRHLGLPGDSATRAGMNERGDTKNWWAGVSAASMSTEKQSARQPCSRQTTPTNAKPQLGCVDTSVTVSRNIFDLQSPPVSTPHGSPTMSDAVPDESPTLGGLEAMLLRTPRGSEDRSPTTPPALNDDSPTLGYDLFPLPPARAPPELPAVPLVEVLRRIERERALAEWSPKRLGKLPAILFEAQPDYHSEQVHASHREFSSIAQSRSCPATATRCK